MIHPLIKEAYKVLEGKEIGRELAISLAEEIHGPDVLDLASLANKVRDKFAGPFTRCSIINAKSGECSQNCRFCAQSSHNDTEIECYPLLKQDEVIAAARKIYDAGVRSYGYVTSGYGYLDPEDVEFKEILATLDALHEEMPDLKLCVSIGILSRACARALAEHHTWRYNMNLQTSPARYGELISTTHSIDDKIRTIKYLREFDVTICCGGIIGLGENWSDRVDMALAVRELKADGIPLNVLLPIKGTPLENLPPVTPADTVKSFALFRLINPKAMIKFAAGRETRMKDFQALIMLSGASSIITGGYLTTRGRGIGDDELMLGELNDFSQL